MSVRSEVSFFVTASVLRHLILNDLVPIMSEYSRPKLLKVYKIPRKFFDGLKNAVLANGVCGIREAISITLG
jgi:hypothetical protein